MAEPRLFFLSLAPRSVPPREIPVGWRQWQPGEDHEATAFGAAPGARVALLGTGDILLPDGAVGRGAVIAVWADEPDVQWGLSFCPPASLPRGQVQRYRDEAQARSAQREFLADMAYRGEVVRRQVLTGPWEVVPDAV